MSIPPFDPATGLLPAGEHDAAWTEVVARFGWNEHRRRLLDGLWEAIQLLARAGCKRIWINGSFVTAKEEPADIDVTWDLQGVARDRLVPIFLELASPRVSQKDRFGCEFLPNVPAGDSGLLFSEFFQMDRSGLPKGIVVMSLERREG